MKHLLLGMFLGLMIVVGVSTAVYILLARNFPFKSCAELGVGSDWDSWGNEEDFVQSFPSTQQSRVRHCLDRIRPK